MEIKDYILSDEQFEKIRNTKTRHKKECVWADYQILFQSGCDFGVEKRVGNKVTQLIVLVSKRQYYITEGRTIKILTVPLLRKYLKELENELPLPNVYWLGGLCNDQNMAGRILKALRCESYIDMLKRGTIYVYSDKELALRQNGYEDRLSNLYMNASLSMIVSDSTFYNWTVDFIAARRDVTKKQMFRELIGLDSGKRETLLLKSFDAFQYIHDMYGVEWGRKAVEKYMASTVEDGINRRQLEMLLGLFAEKENQFGFAGDDDVDPFVSFEYIVKQNKKNIARRLPAEKMLNYLFHHSCREGYALSMDEFLSDWNKYLKMQIELYGKIEEKYPKYLKSSLKRMEYEYKLHEEEISRKQWMIVSEKMKELEFHDDNYLIKSPRSKEDLAHEASYQHNCVFDYMEQVKRGEEQILFMRKRNEEDVPLVTLEVLPDGRVGQIFRAFNAAPSDKEMEFVRKWAKAKKLILPDNPFPARVANHFMGNGVDDLFDGF